MKGALRQLLLLEVKQFDRVEDAMKAIQELDQMEFHGKVMRV